MNSTAEPHIASPLSRAEKYEEHLRAMLYYIESFTQTHHYPPTVRDLMAGLDISSSSVTQYRLDELERRKSISRMPRVSRSIYVTKNAPVTRKRANHDQ